MTSAIRINFSKVLVLLSLIIIACTFVTKVHAVEGTNSGTTRKDLAQQRVDSRKEIAQVRIEALNSLKEKIASRQATLKLKLSTFRDKIKAQITDRINTTLNRINQNQTTQMQKHLDKMSKILAKLQTRVNSNSPDIKDINLANLAIASASSSIASASAAVKLQSEKDYTLNISTESAVRKEAQATRNLLHTDLQNLRKLVIDAKQAVANAIRVAKSGKLTIPGKEATNSGSI